MRTLRQQSLASSLKNGDVVELGDRKFKIIHTPSHRPGNICLYDPKNKTLITGDSVCGDRTDLIRMDKSVYIICPVARAEMPTS